MELVGHIYLIINVVIEAYRVKHNPNISNFKNLPYTIPFFIFKE